MQIIEYLKTIKYFFDREWHFLLYTRRKLFLFILITPIVLSTIIIGVFANPSIREIPVAIIDQDNSALSRNLIDVVNASPYVKITESLTSMEEARKLMAAGKIYGIVLIPENLSKRIIGYKGAEVILYYNNELFLVGALVNKGVLTAVKDFSDVYTKKLFMKYGVPAYDVDFQVNPVLLSEKILFNPYLNYQYFFVFGLIPAAFQLFVISSLIYGILFEERSGRYHDIVYIVDEAPFSYTLGKLIPYAVLYTFSGTIMLFILFVIMKVPMVAGFGKLLFATLCYIYVSMAAGLFISIILRPLAYSAAAVYAAPTFAYAGISYPQIAMPKFAYYLSEFFPLTHYHRVLVNEAIRGSAPYNSTFYEIAYMLILGTVAFAVSIGVIKIYTTLYIRRHR